MKPSCCYFLALLAASTSIAAENQPAPHDLLPGNDAKAHYVHLTGYNTLSVSRQELVALIRECLANPGVQPPVPFNEADLPEHTMLRDVHIYAGRERTLERNTTTLYSYNPISCALTKLVKTDSSINAATGTCKLNPGTRLVTSDCDFTRPKRRETRPRGSLPISGRKVVAGHECDVLTHRTKKKSTVCLAYGGSFAPYPSNYSPDGKVAGLPVEVHPIEGYLTAAKVRFDMDVNADLFSVPPEYKMVADEEEED